MQVGRKDDRIGSGCSWGASPVILTLAAWGAIALLIYVAMGEPWRRWIGGELWAYVAMALIGVPVYYLSGGDWRQVSGWLAIVVIEYTRMGERWYWLARGIPRSLAPVGVVAIVFWLYGGVPAIIAALSAFILSGLADSRWGKTWRRGCRRHRC